MRQSIVALLTLGASSLLGAGAVHGEGTSVRAAKQFGLGYLQYMIMEDEHLIEKHAKAAGLGEVRSEWNTFRSSDVMNDALLSGNVDFVSLGVPGLMTIWDRTKGGIDVRGASGLNLIPLALNVRGERIKSLKDFTEKDKIAMPAIKVSNQAILLQMAAAKEFGDANWNKLDAITQTMAHPDATLAMISGQADITANFSSVPYQQRQLKTPGIRTMMTSTDILGGPFSFNLIATTSKFRSENPKLYAAFLSALGEATDKINADKKWAAEAYLRLSKDKMPLADVVEIMNDPTVVFTTKVGPMDTMVAFMGRTGSYKNKPASGKDLLFLEAQ